MATYEPSDLIPTPTATDAQEGVRKSTQQKEGSKHSMTLRDALRVSTSSQGASLANLSPKLDEEKEREMTVTSGQKCLESYESSNQRGSSVRMLAASLLGTTAWFSNKCRLTWKLRDTKCKRLLFQLAPSMRRTEETGYGLLHGRMLMTPKAGDGVFASGSTSGRPREKSTHLATQIAMLPTPTTQEVEHPKAELSHTGRRVAKNGNTHSVGLMDKIAMLKTPSASEAEGGWKVADKYWNAKAPKLKMRDQVGRKTGLKLQPAFVEWMMGFPNGWTEIPDSKLLEMRLSRKSQKK